MTKTALTEIFQGLDATLRPNEPMSDHTTLGIGGPAELYVEPHSAWALAEVLRLATPCVRVTPLGGGSNVLVSDSGIGGVVVAMGFYDGVEIISRDQNLAIVHAGAGIPLQRLLNYAAGEGLTGLEGLAGIPGLLGGAIAGNAGSFGTEIKDAIANVTLLGRMGDVREAGLDEIRFEYRRALIAEGSIVIGARLKFALDTPELIRERMAGFLSRKKLTQPVAEKSAGSVFKNPPDMSAGQIIDTLGFKGTRSRGYRGEPAARELLHKQGAGHCGGLQAVDRQVIIERVREATGVELEPEIRMVG